MEREEVSTRFQRNSVFDALEKKALLAIFEKSPEEAKRLLLIVSRRNKQGLKTILITILPKPLLERTEIRFSYFSRCFLISIYLRVVIFFRFRSIFKKLN